MSERGDAPPVVDRFPSTLSHYVHLATCDVMLVWMMGLLKTVSELLFLVYCYVAQRCEQFSQIGRLYWALILIGLALCHQSPSVSLIFIKVKKR